MAEVLELHRGEDQKTAIPVNYELPEGVSPLFQIDGKALLKALRESGYNESITCPITITDSGMPGSLAHYDSIKGRMVVNQEAIASGLKMIRQRELDYLEGIKPNKLKGILQIASGFINPISLPYMTLPNYGAVEHFSGDQRRRDEYLEAAQRGFPDKSGQPRYSQAEAKERARKFIDGLMERVSPGLIGLIVAHEFEHRNKAKRKRGTGIGLTLGPLAIGASTTSSTEGVFAGFLGAYVGYVLDRRMDEKASYDAADKNVKRFEKAVTMDHDLFKQKVIDE